MFRLKNFTWIQLTCSRVRIPNYYIVLYFQGLTPTEIVEGYEKALDKALEILPTLTCYEIKDVRNEAEVNKSIKPALMSKQYGHEDFLTKLITKACGMYYKNIIL